MGPRCTLMTMRTLSRPSLEVAARQEHEAPAQSGWVVVHPALTFDMLTLIKKGGIVLVYNPTQEPVGIVAQDETGQGR